MGRQLSSHGAPVGTSIAARSSRAQRGRRFGHWEERGAVEQRGRSQVRQRRRCGARGAPAASTADIVIEGEYAGWLGSVFGRHDYRAIRSPA